LLGSERRWSRCAGQGESQLRTSERNKEAEGTRAREGDFEREPNWCSGGARLCHGSGQPLSQQALSYGPSALRIGALPPSCQVRGAEECTDALAPMRLCLCLCPCAPWLSSALALSCASGPPASASLLPPAVALQNNLTVSSAGLRPVGAAGLQGSPAAWIADRCAAVLVTGAAAGAAPGGCPMVSALLPRRCLPAASGTAVVLCTVAL